MQTMKVNKSDFFATQAKINLGKLPDGIFNKIGYFFSRYNSMLLPKKINNLAKKLIQEEIENEELKECYEIPKAYKKLFKLYK